MVDSLTSTRPDQAVEVVAPATSVVEVVAQPPVPTEMPVVEVVVVQAAPILAPRASQTLPAQGLTREILVIPYGLAQVKVAQAVRH